VNYFNNLFKLSTDARLLQGSSGYSKPVFARVESEFPLGFFGGLIVTIGFCLLSWAAYVKHQQALAVTDCIDTEMLSPELNTQSKSVPESASQSIMNRLEGQPPVLPEDRLERASDICEMKCIRGSLSGCQ